MQKARKGFLYLYGVSSGICIQTVSFNKVGITTNLACNHIQTRLG